MSSYFKPLPLTFIFCIIYEGYFLFAAGSDKYLKPITSNGVHSAAGSGSGDIMVRRMVAMYDYDPQELSPNVDAEVGLNGVC